MRIVHTITLALATWFATGYNFSVSANSTLPKIFNFQENLSKIEHQWILNQVTPSYMKDFVSIYHQNQHSIKNGNLAKPLLEQEFLDKILDGVTSDSCKVHVTEWFTRFSLENFEGLLGSKDAWVLQMVDAWGKLPEGILSGHINSLGDFDQCVGVEVVDIEILNKFYPEINKNAKRNFVGQYCTSNIFDFETAMSLTPKPIGAQKVALQKAKQETVSLGKLLVSILNQNPSAVMLLPTVGVCMPDSCASHDVQQLLVNGLNLVYEKNFPSFNRSSLPWPATVNCFVKEKPDIDAAAIAVIVLLAILVSLALIAGIMDYWNTCTHETVDTSNPSTKKFLSCGEVYKYFMAFSVYTNMKKLLSTKKSSGDMGCLHGIRFFSTAWVVLAHTYSASLSGPVWNLLNVKNIYKKWTELAVINATFSVDSFFLMSGMLATYNILKLLDKTEGKLNVPMFYIYRYLRLTPTYAILIGISATLLTYTGNGPYWYFVQAGEEFCRKNWWTNIFYVNNLVRTEEMCNGESWYLANDMQFYILAPFIVYPIWNWETMGILLLVIYTILSGISPVLVVRYSHQAPAMVVSNDLEVAKGTVEIYMRPWSRISVFLIGIWLGWILHKTRGKRLNLSRIIIYILWFISGATASLVIFGIFPWFNPNNEIPHVAGYFYAGLSRMSFGIAVAWVIFACVKGYGGFVNSFLSWKIFMPLGRLCFCVYLTSVHLQQIFHLGMTVPMKWNTYSIVNIYFAHVVMSYLVGFVCTLLFESPFITLQKLIFEENGVRKMTLGNTDKMYANNVLDKISIKI